MKINQHRFEAADKNALEFYRTEGYVVLTAIKSKEYLLDLHKAWLSIVEKYAMEIGVDADRYLAEISQWRDLSKENVIFRKLLSDDLAQLGAWSLELPGARLLHDQFIRKNANECNGSVPWHQDSMYWPVDRTGVSTWLAIHDIGASSGCLEVQARSHLGDANRPIDFMSETITFDDGSITAIPVDAGDVVLLHSKTWHRSQPITNGARLAHIALWLPEETCYDRVKASWHPVNNQIKVPDGSLLNEDEFPVFGKRSTSVGSSHKNSHVGPGNLSGMFNARSRLQLFVQKMLGSDNSLGHLLKDPAQREMLALLCVKRYPDCNIRDVEKLIERVWISAAAFEMHRSRNVFKSAYQCWEEYFSACAKK